MFAVGTKEGGTALAVPDVCLTPPYSTPVPYPNTADLAQATGTTSRVFVRMSPVVTSGSCVPSSQGDEAGTLGGVSSGTTQGKCKFTASSSKVFAEGKGVVYQTASTSQNAGNAVGLVASVSQSAVLTAT